MKLVLMSGRAGVGKDHMSRLIQKCFDFRQLGFSDVAKCYGVGMGWWSYEDAYILKPPHVRSLMQQKLTEEHRDLYGEDIWVNAFFAMSKMLNARFGDFDKIVLMDGRFVNEINAVQEAGGLVIRLESDQTNLVSDEHKQHRSETALDTYDFQHTVNNSAQRWATAECEVYSLVWEYLNDD